MIGRWMYLPHSSGGVFSENETGMGGQVELGLFQKMVLWCQIHLQCHWLS
jgi:hypothetical protein